MSDAVLPHIGLPAPSPEHADGVLPHIGLPDPARVQSEGSLQNPTDMANPYNYLTQEVPRGSLSRAQILGLDRKFAGPLAAMTASLRDRGLHFQFSAGGGPESVGHHTPGSLHYVGLAADGWVHDGKGNDQYVPVGGGKKNEGTLKIVQEEAARQGLAVLDEYDEPNNEHLHISWAGSRSPRDPKHAIQVGMRPAISKSKLDDQIEATAVQYGLDPKIFRNMLEAETDYSAPVYKGDSGRARLLGVTSPVGAVGIGQMIPGTMRATLDQMNKKNGTHLTQEDYMTNLQVQLNAAAFHFKSLLGPETNHNYAQALAAYNAGLGDAAGSAGLSHFLKTGQIGYKETRDYVSKILGVRNEDAFAAFSDPRFQYNPAKAVQNQLDRDPEYTEGIKGLTFFSHAKDMASMLVNPAEYGIKPEDMAARQEAARFWQDRWASNLNELFLGIPGLAGNRIFTQSSGSEKEAQAKAWEGFEVSNPDKWMDLLGSHSDMLWSMPASILMAQCILPKIGAAVMGGVTEHAAAKLMAGAAARSLPTPVQNWVAKIVGQGGPGLLEESLHWMTTEAFRGFNHSVGEQFQQGKTFGEALPGAIGGALWNGGLAFIGTFFVPKAASFMLGTGRGMAGLSNSFNEMGAQLRSGQGVGPMRFLAGAGGQAFMKLVDSAWELPGMNATRAIAARGVGAVIDGMAAVEKHVFMGLWSDTFTTLDDSMAKAAAAAGYSRSAASFEDEAAHVASSRTDLEHVLGTMQGKLQAATQQEQQAGALVQQALADPQAALYVAEKTKLEAAQQALKQAVSVPAAQQNKGLVHMLTQGVRAQENIVKALHPEDVTTPAGKYEAALAAHGTAQQAQQALQQQPMLQNAADIQEQIGHMRSQEDICKAFADAHRQVSDMTHPGYYENADGTIGIPRMDDALVLDPYLSNRMNKQELRLYAGALRQRAQDSMSAIQLPGMKELEQESIRSWADAPQDPGNILQALTSASSWLRDEASTQAGHWTKAQKLTQAKIIESVDKMAKRIENVMRTPGATRGDLHARLDRIPVADLWKTLRDNDIPVAAFMGGGDHISRVYQDPNLLAMTEENMVRAASMRFTEAGQVMNTGTGDFGMGGTPSAALARRALEIGAEVGQHIDPVGMKAIDGVAKALGGTMEVRDALHTYVNRAIRSGITGPDGVYGVMRNLYESASGRFRSADYLSIQAGKVAREAFEKAFKLRPGQSVPKNEMLSLVHAIEGGSQSLEDAIRRNPELVQALQPLFSLQSLLERYKILTPELKNSFTEYYFNRIYPRRAMWMNIGGNDDTALTPRTSHEKMRTRQFLLDTQAQAVLAEREILHKTGSKWNEWIALDTPQERAAALAAHTTDRAALRPHVAAVTPQMVGEANDLLEQVLLGDAVTDPSFLVQQQYKAALNTATIRDVLNTVGGLEADGKPLMALVEQAGANSPKYHGLRRGWTLGAPEPEPYQNLGRLPGMSGYKVKNPLWNPLDTTAKGLDAEEFIDAAHMVVHPQVAQFIKSHMTNDTPKGLMKAWSEMVDLSRTVELMGSPLRHTNTVMSNMWLMSGGNMGKAAGTISAGAFRSMERPEVAIRAVQAGLLPNNMLRNAKVMTDDFMQGKAPNGGPNPLAELLGNTPEKHAAVDKIQQMFSVLGMPFRAIKKTAEWAVGGDHFMNRLTMYQAISDAQLGSWQTKTAEIWHKMAPDLISKFGYSGGLYQAERLAAREINKAAAVTPSWYLSSGMRKVLYNLMLSPNLAATRIDTMVGVLDGLTRKIGGRSRFVHEFDEASRRMEAGHLRNFFAGCIAADFVFLNTMSHLLNNHSTLQNPDERKWMHLMVGGGPNGNTYCSSPVFGMFRTALKLGGALAGADGKAATSAVMGNFHKGIQTLGKVMLGGPEYGSNRGPESINPMHLENWSNAANFAFYNLFPTPEVPFPWLNPGPGSVRDRLMIRPKRDYPAPGTPMSLRDYVLQVAGAFPTHAADPWAVTGKNLGAKQKFAESQMTGVAHREIEEIFDLPGGIASPEGLKKWQALVGWCYDQGLPQQDKSMIAAYSKVHPSGNFVFTETKQLMQILNSKEAPYAAAMRSVPKILQPILEEKVREMLGKQVDRMSHGRSESPEPAGEPPDAGENPEMEE